MAMYLLDTNHVSPLVTMGHPLQQQISRRISAGDRFGIAVPSLAEMLFGIQVLPRATQNLVRWREIEGFFDYYQIEKQDAEDAAALQVALRRQGWQLATVDALIAVIGLRFDLTLLTTDNDYIAVPDLKRGNWLSTIG